MPRPNKVTVRFHDQIHEFDLSSEKKVAVLATDDYRAWATGIVDKKTKARIYRDVGKLERGLFGDWKEVDGIFEIRLDYGPGYRVYYAKVGNLIIVLLGGGDKGSQKADIRHAQRLWKELKNEITQV